MANPPDSDLATSEPAAALSGSQASDVVAIIALAAGLASSLSGQQPTGNAMADVLLPFLFGALIVWIAQFAKRQAVLISSVIALFFTGLAMPSALMGLVAVASIVFVAQRHARIDEVTTSAAMAVAAAFTSQAALNLPNIRFVGSASILAAIAISPLVWSGFTRLPPTSRKLAVRLAMAGTLLALVATALAGIAALGVRDHVEVGIAQAEDGIAALEAGDQPQAVELLTASQQNFELANSRLGGPLTWPARWVPVVAQHSRALETASDQGVALTQTAARTVNQADVEKIKGSNGAIDLELVAAVNAELHLANVTLRDAQQSLRDVDSLWLVPQLSSRLTSVQSELENAAQDIDLANHATSVMPGILGGAGPRRYLILFVQPSESREFGGFVGAYGVLEANQGRLSLAESGSIDVDLGNGVTAARLTDATSFPEPYLFSGPDVNPQNITAVADLTTISNAARDLVPQWRQDPSFTIDGVITLDPYAIAGLLELTGPLAIEGRDELVDASNVVDFLLRDQYLDFDDVGRDARQDVLKVLAGQAFAQLLTGDIPGPERLGNIFGPIARANRLSFATFDPDENAFLTRVFLSADLPRVGSAVDMVGLFGQTATASKLDGYSSRSTTYNVEVDPATGLVQGELQVVERNDAPVDAGEFVLGNRETKGLDGTPLPLGANLRVLAFYTRAEVEDVNSDGAFLYSKPLPALSYTRHPVLYEVPLGGETTVAVSTTFQVEPGRYDVFIPAQASAVIGAFTLNVVPAPGWRVVGEGVTADGSWSQNFSLDEPLGLTFRFEPKS